MPFLISNVVGAGAWRAVESREADAWASMWTQHFESRLLGLQLLLKPTCEKVVVSFLDSKSRRSNGCSKPEKVARSSPDKPHFPVL